MRYYDPLNGKILINYVDLKDVDVKGLRRKIGYVGQ
jgi:ABC-type multidrug transport system fused ATPase/permease subunit